MFESISNDFSKYTYIYIVILILKESEVFNLKKNIQEKECVNDSN